MTSPNVREIRDERNQRYATNKRLAAARKTAEREAEQRELDRIRDFQHQLKAEAAERRANREAA